jgi:hypothetical protein
MMKLICSAPTCANEIMGSVCVVADAGNEDEEPMEWGDLNMYSSSDGKNVKLDGFALLHPNCFKDFQDEVLRQERGLVITVGFMKVDDAREALQLV